MPDIAQSLTTIEYLQAQLRDAKVRGLKERSHTIANLQGQPTAAEVATTLCPAIEKSLAAGVHAITVFSVHERNSDYSQHRHIAAGNLQGEARRVYSLLQALDLNPAVLTHSVRCSGEDEHENWLEIVIHF